MKRFFHLCRLSGLICCVLFIFGGVGESPAAQSAEPAVSALRSLSGRGDNVEVILKFLPFQAGGEVALTAYVLAADSNEPVRGATVSGTMSGGTESLDVAFAEQPQPLAGVYTGTVRVAGGKPYSWLFDIALGDKSDLVAIDGFQAGAREKNVAPAAAAAGEPSETCTGHNLTTGGIVAFIALFAALQAAIIMFFRRRFPPGSSAKEPR